MNYLENLKWYLHMLLEILVMGFAIVLSLAILIGCALVFGGACDHDSKVALLGGGMIVGGILLLPLVSPCIDYCDEARARNYR